MERSDDTRARLDQLSAQVAEHHADIEQLQVGVAQTSLREELNAGRLEALEERSRVLREMVLELQVDGLVAKERTVNLETALESSRLIGAAIGIVMAFYAVPEAAAFDILRKASQDTNQKLRVLAEEVVLTGSAKGLPRPDPSTYSTATREVTPEEAPAERGR